MIAEETWNGSTWAPARQYVNGGQYIDERVVMRDIAGGGQDHYYLLEELYSVAGLAGAVGQLEEMYVYDTYGRATVWAWRPGDVNRDSLVDAADTAQYDTWRTAGSPLADLHADGTLAYGQDPNLDLAVIEDHLNMIPEPVTYSSLDNPFMFTGRLTDTINDADEPVITQETRFRRIQDNRNRMYDPHHGRWFQRDPLGVRPDAPRAKTEPEKQYTDGMNVHQYVRSRPIDAVDPDGLQDPSGMASLFPSCKSHRRLFGHGGSCTIVLPGMGYGDKMTANWFRSGPGQCFCCSLCDGAKVTMYSCGLKGCEKELRDIFRGCLKVKTVTVCTGTPQTFLDLPIPYFPDTCKGGDWVDVPVN